MAQHVHVRACIRTERQTGQTDTTFWRETAPKPDTWQHLAAACSMECMPSPQAWPSQTSPTKKTTISTQTKTQQLRFQRHSPQPPESHRPEAPYQPRFTSQGHGKEEEADTGRPQRLERGFWRPYPKTVPSTLKRCEDGQEGPLLYALPRWHWTVGAVFHPAQAAAPQGRGSGHPESS